jgi:uncharacterized protein
MKAQTLHSILTKLSEEFPSLQKKYNIQRIGVFGSYARKDNVQNSDIDVVVHMPPSAFQIVHLRDFLEELLDRSVDIVRYREGMNSFLRSQIDREATYVSI